MGAHLKGCSAFGCLSNALTTPKNNALRRVDGGRVKSTHRATRALLFAVYEPFFPSTVKSSSIFNVLYFGSEIVAVLKILIC